MSEEKVEYVVVHEHRICSASGCTILITHYAVKKGEEGGPVWCRAHAHLAWKK